MGILDNFEAAWDDSDLELAIQNPHIKEDKCHYCQKQARYTDVAQVDKDSYDMVGICRCHLSMEASS